MCIVCPQTIHKLYTDYAWSLPQPLPKGKGFVAALMHRTWGSFLETKSGGDKGSKRQRVGETKGLRVKEREGGRERKTMGRQIKI